MTQKKETFEEGMQSLQALIDELSEGGLSLEESMKTYEQGMKLVSMLQKKLEHYYKKIEMVDPDTGEIKPFEENEYGV